MRIWQVIVGERSTKYPEKFGEFFSERLLGWGQGTFFCTGMSAIDIFFGISR